MPKAYLPFRLFTPTRGLVRAASLYLLLCALAACDDNGTGVQLPTRITIAPSEPVSVYAGDTLTVKGTIHNGAHPDVAYSSSNPSVAAVDRVTGLVTAVAPGQAVIAAFSAIDPRILATLAVTVLPDVPASLTVVGLLEETGVAADPASVDGVLELRLQMERGNARRLEVRLRDEVVCEQGYVPVPAEPPPSSATVTCFIDTGAFDAADGTPRFRNGAGRLTARLLGGGDRELAGTPGLELFLANRARLVAMVQAARQATDGAGEWWMSGDLTVLAQPVMYDPSKSVASVSFAYRSPAGVDTAAVDSDAPFTLTLPAAGILGNVTDPALQVMLSSTEPGGAEGPSASTSALRYDAAPPQPGTLLPLEWIGAQTQFSQTYSSAGESDAGVGRMHLRFFAGDPALSAAEIVASGRQVSVGSDLPQAPRQSYRLALQVCDVLDNCALRDGFLFGVDLTPPLIESFNIEDLVANPGEDLVLGLRDDLSGFAARPLEVSVSLLDGDPSTATCGPVVEGIDLPGRAGLSGCVRDTLPNLVPIPRTTAGYYTYEIVAFDGAGNRSVPARRGALIDLQPPTLTSLSTPATLTPGEELSASVQATDNLELESVDFRLVYPGAGGSPGVAFPLGAPYSAGAAFDEVLSASATAVGILPFVRTLTYGRETAGSRSTVIVDSLRVSARDAAGLRAAIRWRIPRATFANDTSTADPYPRFGAIVATADRTSVCSAGCVAGDPTSVRIAVRVDGESGTGRPFARLHFYRRGADGQLAYLASVAGSDATITNTGTQSTFVYGIEHVPPARLVGDFTLVAVGVTSRGNALITPISGPAAPSLSFYLR